VSVKRQLIGEALEKDGKERILDLQARKADLAASILEGGAEHKSDGPLFDEEDLALLFVPAV
jgi:hypothetical protein